MNDSSEVKKERVEWVDIVRFLGIFAIYLGHFMTLAGHAYRFVFRYHVPLFFLISGCMSYYDNEPNFFKYTIKKAKTILVPFYAFSLVSILINIIMSDGDIGLIKGNLLLVLKGCIRNQFFAGSLWFFTCLFLVEIVFKLLKYLKFKPVILIIAIALYVVSETLIEPKPLEMPHLFFNADSMLHYIVYFAIGYVVYPFLLSFLKLDSVLKKIAFSALLIVTGIYSLLVFLERDILLEILGDGSIVLMFEPVVKALIIILFNILISKFLCGINLFRKIGSETLYICGNEYIIKTLFPAFIELMGLTMAFSNPIYLYVYVAILLIINVKILIPAEKALVKSIKDVFIA